MAKSKNHTNKNQCENYHSVVVHVLVDAVSFKSYYFSDFCCTSLKHSS